MASETKSTAQKPLNELLTNELVTIFVGAQKKEWILHKELLCARSEFFRAAFTGNFKEASNKTLHLPEDDERAFGLLVGWMYTGRLEDDVDWEELHCWTYLFLYVLGSKLSMESLRNSAMDHIRTHYREYQRELIEKEGLVETVNYVFSQAPEGSSLRIWTAAAAASSMDGNGHPRVACNCEVYERNIHADGEFAFLVIKAMSARRAMHDAYEDSAAADCVFHEHKHSEKCEIANKRISAFGRPRFAPRK